MKFNYHHFKFHIKSRVFKKSVWDKYYSLKKQKKLNDYDKYWMKQFRAEFKLNQFKLIGKHIPSNTEFEWTIKKDLNKEKLDLKHYIGKLILKLKEKRIESKTIKTTSRTFDGASYCTIGGVFTKTDSIRPLSGFLTTNDPLKPKKPRHSNKNYIGIELEFNQLPGIQKSDIALKLKETGLARYVDVTTDGSCGWEVRVLLLEDEYEPILTKIMNTLDGMGFQTNDQCGTHVHFDMRNRNVKIVYENLFKTQKFLRKFLPRNRKYNSYCKLNKESSFDNQMNIRDRYYSLNVQSYSKHRTIEVRMHYGTLKANDLIPWINLLLRVINYKSVVEKSINTLKQARDKFGLDKKLENMLESKMLTIFRRAGKKAAPNVRT